MAEGNALSRAPGARQAGQLSLRNGHPVWLATDVIASQSMTAGTTDVSVSGGRFRRKLRFRQSGNGHSRIHLRILMGRSRMRMVAMNGPAMENLSLNKARLRASILQLVSRLLRKNPLQRNANRRLTASFPT